MRTTGVWTMVFEKSSNNIGRSCTHAFGKAAPLVIRVLGPVAITRDGDRIALPRSRKVLALLAYLALESSRSTPLSRSRLCDLLWDVPNDPRGELRWCLSKLRGLLDDDEHVRVVTTGQNLVAIDLSD